MVGDEVSVQAVCLNSYHTKTCDCRERHSPAIRRERESDETSATVDIKGLLCFLFFSLC